MLRLPHLLGSGFQLLLLWLQLLQECNIDLLIYGRREAELLESYRHCDEYDGTRHFWVDGLVYGSTPEDWDVEIMACRTIEFWRPAFMTIPGQWPADYANPPRILPWEPGVRDHPYLDPSLHSSEAWISKSIDALHEPTTVRKVMQDFAEMETVRNQRLSHQDDHDIINLEMHRTSRPRHRSTSSTRRACSEPAPTSFVVDLNGRLLLWPEGPFCPWPAQYDWIPWHRCAANGRWRPGSYEPRDCLWQSCGLPDAFWADRFERMLKHHSANVNH